MFFLNYPRPSWFWKSYRKYCSSKDSESSNHNVAS